MKTPPRPDLKDPEDNSMNIDVVGTWVTTIYHAIDGSGEQYPRVNRFQHLVWDDEDYEDEEL